MFGVFCGNMTGKNLLGTGDLVKIYLNQTSRLNTGDIAYSTLVSPQGKWDGKEAE